MSPLHSLIHSQYQEPGQRRQEQGPGNGQHREQFVDAKLEAGADRLIVEDAELVCSVAKVR